MTNVVGLSIGGGGTDPELDCCVYDACIAGYADDDAVLFTDDPTKWDYVFRNFEASASVMGLHTNWHKTKI